MKIELKSVHYAAFASEETNCYTANLYVDGKKIGTVGNDGHGGCDTFHGDQAAYRAADEWCRANLPKWTGYRGEALETDIEVRCGTLFEDWLTARELRKTLQTTILFTQATDGRLYQVRHRGEIDRKIAAIASAHPGATFLNGKPFEAALALYRIGTAP